MKDDKPSRTSLFVALLVLIIGGDEHTPLPPGLLDATIDFLRASNLCLVFPIWLWCNPVTSKLARWTSDFLFEPDLLAGLARRKWFMEEQLRQALTTKSCQQVLIVAAGYDTLVHRCCQEYSNVEFWEVDHPATGKVKLRALETMMNKQQGQNKQQQQPGQLLPRNFHTLHVDLSKLRLSQVLQTANGFETSRPTLVIVEGLLYYLPDVSGLFHEIALSTGQQSKIAFDFIPDKRSSSLARRIIQTVAKIVREPMLWMIQEDEVNGFLAETDWELLSPPGISSRGLERMAVVQKRSHSRR